MNITIKELRELKYELEAGANNWEEGFEELIEKTGERLCNVFSVEGQMIKGKDSLWGSCWEYKTSMTPEEEYDHHIRYIDDLIELYEIFSPKNA